MAAQVALRRQQAQEEIEATYDGRLFGERGLLKLNADSLPLLPGLFIGGRGDGSKGGQRPLMDAVAEYKSLSQTDLLVNINEGDTCAAMTTGDTLSGITISAATATNAMVSDGDIAVVDDDDKDDDEVDDVDDEDNDDGTPGNYAGRGRFSGSGGDDGSGGGSCGGSSSSQRFNDYKTGGGGSKANDDRKPQAEPQSQTGSQSWKRTLDSSDGQASDLLTKIEIRTVTETCNSFPRLDSPKMELRELGCSASLQESRTEFTTVIEETLSTSTSSLPDLFQSSYHPENLTQMTLSPQNPATAASVLSQNGNYFHRRYSARVSSLRSAKTNHHQDHLQEHHHQHPIEHNPIINSIAFYRITNKNEGRQFALVQHLREPLGKCPHSRIVSAATAIRSIEDASEEDNSSFTQASEEVLTSPRVQPRGRPGRRWNEWLSNI